MCIVLLTLSLANIVSNTSAEVFHAASYGITGIPHLRYCDCYQHCTHSAYSINVMAAICIFLDQWIEMCFQCHIMSTPLVTCTG